MDASFKEASKHLGSISVYKDQYDPSLLVRVHRKHNREQYDIQPPLPFVGFDVWNAYEFSYLQPNRLPVSGVLKIVYSSDSEYIVESKSLKLYLNSFNMTRFKGVMEAVETVTQDLNTLLETEVMVYFHDKEGMPSRYFFPSTTRDLVACVTLQQHLHNSKNDQSLVLEHFKEEPSLLQVFTPADLEDSDFLPSRVRLSTNLLRSNCKITNQPDWGDLFIYYKPNEKQMYLDELSLLKYIVSFRSENHFHEEVCEMIYKRLYDILQPEELLVFCQYTRRGGIDINPVRSTHSNLIPSHLIDSSLYCKTLRQ